jgi:hypothetical protein
MGKLKFEIYVFGPIGFGVMRPTPKVESELKIFYFMSVIPIVV